MSGIKRPTDKHLMSCSGRAYPELADEVAELLGVELVPSRQVTYANSEIYVRFEESVRGADAFVIHYHSAQRKLARFQRWYRYRRARARNLCPAVGRSGSGRRHRSPPQGQRVITR